MQNMYLVVQQDPIVASDLSEIIGEFNPAASVTIVESMGQAVDLLSDVATPKFVLVCSTPENVAQSGLSLAIETSKSWLVLINSEHKAHLDLVSNWVHVAAPFTTASLTRALNSITAAER
ncbi:hypothetical protein [Litoreibacter halocynthiae]|uniref:hypothetical protein n=1 Tax=Litoreibacter halocynthiae TaxID=1242689 RepID=UPI00248FB786|nr:hypothetical protein [Litoreibacter halocynthiae]